MNKEITIYHPNARGTGSAMRVAFHDLCGHDRNYVQIEIAPQSSVGNEPTFDWYQSLYVRLNRHDVAEICRVIAGERDEIKGIFNMDRPERDETLSFSYCADGNPGYWAKIDFCDRANAVKRAIMLDPAEAYGLKCAFDHALCPLVFEF